MKLKLLFDTKSRLIFRTIIEAEFRSKKLTTKLNLHLDNVFRQPVNIMVEFYSISIHRKEIFYHRDSRNSTNTKTCLINLWNYSNFILQKLFDTNDSSPYKNKYDEKKKTKKNIEPLPIAIRNSLNDITKTENIGQKYCRHYHR